MDPTDPPEPTPSDGADGQPIAIFAEGIGVVGTTEHGDHVGIELILGGGERVSVLFPSIHFQKLMAAIMAAGHAAHSKQVERFGSQEATLTHQGAEPFTPTGWGFARARTRDGAEVLMMRLTKDDAPIVDAALSLEAADQFARDLLRALGRGPPARRTMQ